MVNILVVDDSPDVRSVVRRILKSKGYAVQEANDGNECIAHLKNRKFELLIIDIVMPVKGGIETLMDIHSHYPGMKIMMISGKVNTEADSFQMLASQFGADIVLRKPFTAEELLQAVNRLLSQQ